MKFFLVVVPDTVELPAVEGLLVAASTHVLEPTSANVREALTQLSNDVRAYLRHSYEPKPSPVIDRSILQAGIKPDALEAWHRTPCNLCDQTGAHHCEPRNAFFIPA